MIPRLSSALNAVTLAQTPPPLLIGERLNTQGSKKAKQLVLEDNIDGLVDLARLQVEQGAHCLDVCVATNERTDESDFMTRLVKQISLEVAAPLVIDSTDPDVIKQSLECIPGRPMINSINLEGDGLRFEQLAPLMNQYGVPAIAMCIGPDGMAKTPQQKLDTANLLFQKGLEYNLQQNQFVFDVLTFTLGTGQDEFLNAGVDTLEGIKLVKKHLPESYTTLGLSNISFGLSPPTRRLVNSVFLYHAIQSGLDSAIVNVKEIIPYGEISLDERKLAEDLIFNKHDDALSDIISHFEGTTIGGSASVTSDVDPTWSAMKRANYRIIHRLKDDLCNDVVSAIADQLSSTDKLEMVNDSLVLNMSQDETHDAAIIVLNQSLLPAMKEVGDLFGSGDLILPFVLKSAECMKLAVSEVEKYLVKQKGVTSKGKIVLGTVYGDVHDIGKNLVKTILENNGYTVYDLGRQVPLQKFVDKIKETNADAVGLSALLVHTSQQMRHFIEYAKKNNLKIPVLCGGAAVTSSQIARIAKQDELYQYGAFYCNTMFDGLKAVDSLVSDDKQTFVNKWIEKMNTWKDDVIVSSADNIPHSNIRPMSDTPKLPDNRIIRLDSDSINLKQIWERLNLKSLFKLSWGVRGNVSSDVSREHEILLDTWKSRVLSEGWFKPSIVYGYFECHAKNDTLIVGNGKDSVEFDFPRSRQSEHLCLADYFGSNDIVALQAVTIGGGITKTLDDMNEKSQYTDAYYLHGLAVETAEALAEWTNDKIRSDLRITNRGLRFSWGYPSCPDVTQHHKLDTLLSLSKSGITLTESGQLIPEQSTAAIIAHHKEAKYFVI